MMFGLPSPWMILGALIAVLSAYFYGHHEGYQQRVQEDDAIIAAKNLEMNKAKEQADADLTKAKAALAAKNQQYVSAVRDGSLRLSIPVNNSAGCSASAGGDGQARAELDGQVSEALIAITNDGDQAIADLNSCITRYNQVRDIAHAQ
jgi:hypothetical protein